MRGKHGSQGGELRRQPRQGGVEQADEGGGRMADNSARVVADAALGIVGVLQAAHVDDEAGGHWR